MVAGGGCLGRAALLSAMKGKATRKRDDLLVDVGEALFQIGAAAARSIIPDGEISAPQSELDALSKNAVPDEHHACR